MYISNTPNYNINILKFIVKPKHTHLNTYTVKKHILTNANQIKIGHMFTNTFLLILTQGITK